MNKATILYYVRELSKNLENALDYSSMLHSQIETLEEKPGAQEAAQKASTEPQADLNHLQHRVTALEEIDKIRPNRVADELEHLIKRVADLEDRAGLNACVDTHPESRPNIPT